MKATISTAVNVAFKAMKDLAVPGIVTLKKVDYDWSEGAQVADTRRPCDVVLVSDTQKGGEKRHYAIIKFQESIPAFSILSANGKTYKCGEPITSYKFVALVDVYEVQ